MGWNAAQDDRQTMGSNVSVTILLYKYLIIYFSVHNTAPFRITRAAAPYMRDASKEEIEKGGKSEPRCIVNVSSTSGLHGNIGQSNYATGKKKRIFLIFVAKLGIVGLTKTVAKEWGMFGVRCNAV